MLTPDHSDDNVLETSFSMLRWIFVVVATVVYFTLYHRTMYDLVAFSALFVFGVLYMGITEYILRFHQHRSKLYFLVTRCSILFDIIAFCALLGLTGGMASPLFSIAFLIILHNSVYWGFRGGVLSASILSVGYVAEGIGLSHGIARGDSTIYILHVMFLLMVGIVGGLIVSRERKHLSEKREFENLAKRDYLTGLLNHRTFQDVLKAAVNKGLPFVLAMADIDCFKQINDDYGHVSGDRVLQGIGEVLQKHLSGQVGTAFRYGGEEFALLVMEPEQAMDVLERIQQSLALLTFDLDDHAVTVTMSMGVASFNGESPSYLVEKADKRLYAAKSMGRDRIVGDLCQLQNS